MFKNSNKPNYVLIAILEISYKDLVLDSDEIQFGENPDVTYMETRLYIWICERVDPIFTIFGD